MSKLTEALRFQGRFGHETEDQMRARKVKERIAAADELEALAASHQRLKEALTRLLTQFPTDTDMVAAGWENSEVNAACDAYDHAREALRSAP